MAKLLACKRRAHILPPHILELLERAGRLLSRLLVTRRRETIAVLRAGRAACAGSNAVLPCGTVRLAIGVVEEGNSFAETSKNSGIVE